LQRNGLHGGEEAGDARHTTCDERLGKQVQRVSPIYNLPTWFYVNGEEWHCEERGVFLLPIGSGVLSNDGRFYRIRDAWFSFDHHGQGGNALFLRVGEDRPVVDPAS
jgi:hypothetical protein